MDSTVPEHRRAASAIEKAMDGEVLVNTVIQIEVAHYLVKRLGAVAGKETAELFLPLPLTVDPLEAPPPPDALRMLSRYTHVGIRGRGASLLPPLGTDHR